MKRIRLDSIVRLKRTVFPRGKREVALVMAVMGNGGMRVDPPLDGCRFWNVVDLEIPKRAGLPGKGE